MLGEVFGQDLCPRKGSMCRHGVIGAILAREEESSLSSCGMGLGGQLNLARMHSFVIIL